jgi:glucose/arabinose dehydrogenase
MKLFRITKYLYIVFLSIILSNVNFSQVSYLNAFPDLNFEFVVDIQSTKEFPDYLFVVEQSGKIQLVNLEQQTKEEFLDLSSKLLFGGEQGLLGLAFHPNFPDSNYFYLNYTVGSPRRTLITRVSVSKLNSLEVINGSEIELLSVDQPFSNHNGGQIAFGPDGYLYISCGDGGSGGDPQNNAQNRSNLLGTIARIDVDSQDSGIKYSIPDSNPYKGNTDGFREEIFAYGLRNVWRFSFDSQGNIWAGDVGQNALEEIHLIESGKNYGWRIIEGSQCFNPAIGCDKNGLELPIFEYSHASGAGRSITGGYVYEGNSIEPLKQKYVYGDFVSGNIWSLQKSDDQVINTLIANTDLSVSTFGIDQNKELYFADYGSGIIYKFIDNSTSVENNLYDRDYRLEQNYPNPFNPVTSIQYNIPNQLAGRQDSQFSTLHSEPVTLKIYDITGREVATLVNENQISGNYTIVWDGSEQSSGIYFYKLTTNNFERVNKMILLK